MNFEKNFFNKNNLNNQTEKKNSVPLNNLRSKMKKIALGALIVSNLGANANNSFDNYSIKGSNKESNRYDSNIIEKNNNFEFQAINFFDSDSDHISPEAEVAIGLDFQKLLDQVNENNFIKTIEDGITIFSSADPERTKNFLNNEELAQARAESLIVVLKKYINEAEFSNLSKDQAKKLKDQIKFSIIIPTSKIVENPQVGVTYPEDLGYTKEELSKMSEDEKEQIYSQCRLVTVHFSAENSKSTYEITREELTERLKMNSIKPLIPEKIGVKVNWDADMIMIMVDNSPSVGDNSYKEILKKITSDQNLVGKKIDFSFFSDKLNESIACEDISEVIDIVGKDKYKGSNIEHALSSSLDKLRSLPENNRDSKILKIFTDEKLQDVSINMVIDFQLEMSKKNTDAKFYYIDNQKGLMQIDASSIKNAIENELLKDMHGVLKNYLNNKSSEIKGLKKEQRVVIKNQLKDLKLSYEIGDLYSVLNNPLINDVYNIRDAKGVLMNKNLRNVSLEGLGDIATPVDLIAQSDK